MLQVQQEVLGHKIVRQTNRGSYRVLPGSPYGHCVLAGTPACSSIGFASSMKFFELSNHLGNVMATISDLKVGIPQSGSTTLIDHYEASVISAQDYYPFGISMPGRQFSVGSYRYGFNGKENDNEVKGQGNQQDYGFRIYNPGLGRFLSVDPLTKKIP